MDLRYWLNPDLFPNDAPGLTLTPHPHPHLHPHATRDARMKALFRRGQAKQMSGREGDAYFDYKNALELEPHNTRLLKALESLGTM